MPNWCNNTLELQHDNPEMIERAFKSLKDDRFFKEFFPCPKELTETVSGSSGEGYAKELHEFQMQLNKKYFGFVDWYDWTVANWGTKWDVCEAYCDQHEPNLLVASYDTAWSPPIAFYEKMKELGFTVRAFYYEPGMAFCGNWDDGDDNYYSIEGNSKWVSENIPDEIDSEFGISEGMAIWEDEEEEV